MRQIHMLRIIIGVLVGCFSHIFYQVLFGQQNLRLSSKDLCQPCKDETKIRGEPCPLCGPEHVEMAKDPDILDPYKPKGMYEVTRWYYFDEEYLYDIINGEPKVKLLGSWYEETKSVVQVALEYVNTNRMLGRTWNLVGLQNGYLRTDVLRGTDYILDLNVKSVESHPSESVASTFRVKMVHSFVGENDLKIVSYRKADGIGIHIIVPVTGTKEVLIAFIKQYASVLKKQVLDTKLTLVLFKGKGKFGEKSVSLKPVVEEQMQQFPDVYIDFIELPSDYNYLHGIHKAIEYVNTRDVVLSLKLDMHFGEDLLQTCRLLAVRGKRAYFPIAFSQYDPDIIERGMPPGKPKNINKMDINKFTGYWMHRVHDFICAFDEDLFPVLNRASMTVVTAPQNEEAIGSEGGTQIYDLFLTNNIEVISAVQPDLIRIFRRRNCDQKNLSLEEYQQCFQLSAEMLGSKPALSILYLTEIALKKV